MSQILRKYVIMAISMILLSITFVKCLPITSKPIENTPENLAWEAWLMLPPSHNERTRKITPKSIFILNGSQDGFTHNGNSNLFSNSGSSLPQPQPQIQCPPNHRIENSKCIPTLSIDRDKIMIQEFAQLFGNPANSGDITSDGNQSNSPNYNYDIEEYDYGDYNPDDTLTDDITLSNINFKKNDFNRNEQPLKISLSLDGYSVVSNNKKLEQSNTGLLVKPLLAEELSSTTSATEQIIGTEAPIDFNYQDKTLGDTKIALDTSKTRRNYDQQSIISSTTFGPIKQINDLDLSKYDTDTTLFSTTDETNDTISTISPILIPKKFIELIDKNISLSVTDYETTEDETQILTTTQTNEGNNHVEFVTESPGIEREFADSLAQESLLYDEMLPQNFSQISLELESTVYPIETTTFDEMVTTVVPEITATITTNMSEIKQKMIGHEQKFHPVVSSISSHLQIRNSVELHKNSEQIMNHTKNNNRFIYHPLLSSAAPKLQSYSEKANNDKNIAEQLRIINMIVEEKNRKSQQLQTRLPDDNLRSSEHRDNLNTDLIQFPKVTAAVSKSAFEVLPTSSFSFPKNPFIPDKYLIHRQFLQSSPPNVASTQKPFWWLPVGWQVNHNGERPFLIIRSSTGEDTTTKSASTTSGYRENSRSPTENLYKEIPAQEFYKVLSAGKQWKHNSKR